MKVLGISMLMVGCLSLTACGGAGDGRTVDAQSQAQAPLVVMAEPAVAAPPSNDPDVTPEALLPATRGYPEDLAGYRHSDALVNLPTSTSMTMVSAPPASVGY